MNCYAAPAPGTWGLVLQSERYDAGSSTSLQRRQTKRNSVCNRKTHRGEPSQASRDGTRQPERERWCDPLLHRIDHACSSVSTPAPVSIANPPLQAWEQKALEMYRRIQKRISSGCTNTIPPSSQRALEGNGLPDTDALELLFASWYDQGKCSTVMNCARPSNKRTSPLRLPSAPAALLQCFLQANVLPITDVDMSARRVAHWFDTHHHRTYEEARVCGMGKTVAPPKHNESCDGIGMPLAILPAVVLVIMRRGQLSVAEGGKWFVSLFQYLLKAAEGRHGNQRTAWHASPVMARPEYVSREQSLLQIAITSTVIDAIFLLQAEGERAHVEDNSAGTPDIDTHFVPLYVLEAALRQVLLNLLGADALTVPLATSTTPVGQADSRGIDAAGGTKNEGVAVDRQGQLPFRGPVTVPDYTPPHTEALLNLCVFLREHPRFPAIGLPGTMQSDGHVTAAAADGHDTDPAVDLAGERRRRIQIDIRRRLSSFTAKAVQDIASLRHVPLHIIILLDMLLL